MPRVRYRVGVRGERAGSAVPSCYPMVSPCTLPTSHAYASRDPSAVDHYGKHDAERWILDGERPLATAPLWTFSLVKGFRFMRCIGKSSAAHAVGKSVCSMQRQLLGKYL